MSTKTAQDTYSSQQALPRAEYVNLTTFRKNGMPVATPVWSAEHNGTYYVETAANIGKVKRIRHTPRVTLTPCTATGKAKGASVPGQARIIASGVEIYTARGALHRKYGFKRQAFYFVMEAIRILRRQPEGQDAYLAIEIIREV